MCGCGWTAVVTSCREVRVSPERVYPCRTTHTGRDGVMEQEQEATRSKLPTCSLLCTPSLRLHSLWTPAPCRQAQGALVRLVRLPPVTPQLDLRRQLILQHPSQQTRLRRSGPCGTGQRQSERSQRSRGRTCTSMRRSRTSRTRPFVSAVN